MGYPNKVFSESYVKILIYLADILLIHKFVCLFICLFESTWDTYRKFSWKCHEGLTLFACDIWICIADQLCSSWWHIGCSLPSKIPGCWNKNIFCGPSAASDCKWLLLNHRQILSNLISLFQFSKITIATNMKQHELF